jgi:hypothetical protein
MRYVLIVLGLLVALLGIYITLESRPAAAVGPPVTVVGGLAVVAGLMTCEIVDALRARRP